MRRMDDRPLSTGAAAARSYRGGVADLLAGRADAAVSAFTAAVAQDPGFSLGHAALAVARAEQSPPGDPDDPALAAAARSARGETRWERQHVAIVRLALEGALVRAGALAREHLAEFPDDPLIVFVVTRRCAGVDDLASRQTSASGVVAPPRANASS